MKSERKKKVEKVLRIWNKSKGNLTLAQIVNETGFSMFFVQSTITEYYKMKHSTAVNERGWRVAATIANWRNWAN